MTLKLMAHRNGNAAIEAVFAQRGCAVGQEGQARVAREKIRNLTLSDPIPVIVYTDGRRIKTLTITYKCIEFDSWLTLLPLRRS